LYEIREVVVQGKNYSFSNKYNRIKLKDESHTKERWK